MALKLAIVGRPNVGKSTLFNRLAGRKLAIVDDRPGVTRDRRYAKGKLGDLDLELIDTAGFEDVTDESLEARMRVQTELAIDEADVACIAALVRTWPLVTGGDSLAPAIIRDRRLGSMPQPGSGRRLLPGARGYEAVLAGSCAQTTWAQLEAFAEQRPLWRVDLARNGDDVGLVDAIAAWAAERLPSGPVAIATTADPDGVAAAQAAFGRDGASQRADRLLANVAIRLRDLGVRKFVIAGGETSGEVLKTLEVERLEVGGYDDLFGGYCHAPGRRSMSFVLKPGGMGDPLFFFSALDRFREAERESSRGVRL